MRRLALLLSLLPLLAACGDSDSDSVRPGSTMPTCYYAAGGPDAVLPTTLEQCQELNRSAQPGVSPAPSADEDCYPPPGLEPGDSYRCRPSPAPSDPSDTPR